MQVAQRGHSVGELAQRLGGSIHSLYAWVGATECHRKIASWSTQSDKMRQLKAELPRVTEERDILE
jgi:transposase